MYNDCNGWIDRLGREPVKAGGEPSLGKPISGKKPGNCTSTATAPTTGQHDQPFNPTPEDMDNIGCKKVKEDSDCEKCEYKVIVYLPKGEPPVKNGKDGGNYHVIGENSKGCKKNGFYVHQPGLGNPVFAGKDPDEMAQAYYNLLAKQKGEKAPEELEETHYCCPDKTKK
ncbi:hypothetical protein JIN78_16495 [Roseibacillus ishigakijimensis]|uniref:Uncharacterized protein n=1 Tax=Roseibacillus ishigakijimensis TaxID=454146 RepID=A0A934RWY0_9BACT|nr:hypothetical protein [Roseibacillus ishigakijimensis]